MYNRPREQWKWQDDIIERVITTETKGRELSDSVRRDHRAVWQRLIDKVVSSELLLAVCTVAAVVVIGVLFGWENNKLIPANLNTVYRGETGAWGHLNFMANLDGRDYLETAVHGYWEVAQANFFPLYPLIVRLANYAIGSPLLSGLLVSWAAFVGATYFYIKILKQLYPMKDKLEVVRAVLFFVLFPTSVFMFAVYTESMFAFLALGAFYFALQKRPYEAGLFTLLATATHENGVFVLALVALVLWEKHEKLQRIAASFGIGCLGIVCYAAFLWRKFGNPLEFVVSQKTSGWLQYDQRLMSGLATREGLFLLLVLIASWYWWRRRKSFALYSLLYAAILLLGNFGGYGRYALMDFPVQLMLYDYFRNKRLGYVIAIAATSAFWMYFLLQFAGGYTGG
jgi:hypothetical protein